MGHAIEERKGERERVWEKEGGREDWKNGTNIKSKGFRYVYNWFFRFCCCLLLFIFCLFLTRNRIFMCTRSLNLFSSHFFLCCSFRFREVNVRYYQSFCTISTGECLRKYIEWKIPISQTSIHVCIWIWYLYIHIIWLFFFPFTFLVAHMLFIDQKKNETERNGKN